MTKEEYLTMKNERDCLKEEIIRLCGVGMAHWDEYRQTVEKLLTLTRVLDRAAAEYAEHKDDGEIGGRNYDFDYQSDP